MRSALHDDLLWYPSGRGVLAAFVGLTLSAAAMARQAGEPIGEWRSNDQISWKAETGKPALDGHSPDMVLLTKATPSRTGPDAGTLLLIAESGDGLVFSRSVDQGRSWTAPAPVTMNGWPPELKDRRARGPSIVQLDDGRVRVYFTAPPQKEQDQPWRKPPKNPKPEGIPVPTPQPDPIPRNVPGLPASPTLPKLIAEPPLVVGGTNEASVYSAISNDGQTFAVEDGTRFKLDRAEEPEVIRLPDNSSGDGDTRRIGPWLMFITKQDKLVLATSKDGLTWMRDETFAWSAVTAVSALTATNGGSPRAVRLFARQGDRLVSAVFDPSTGALANDSKSNLPCNGQDTAAASAGDGTFILIGRSSAADKPRQPVKDVPNAPRPIPSPPPIPK